LCSTVKLTGKNYFFFSGSIILILIKNSPYCRALKQILAKYCKDIKIIEVDLEKDGLGIKSALLELSGRTTFPNLFKNGKSLGGFDNVSILDREGKLEDLCESH
jgi:glutaredoxin